MDEHPKASTQIRENPQLVYDSKFLKSHSEVERFLKARPELRQEIARRPGRVFGYDRDDDRYGRYDRDDRRFGWWPTKKPTSNPKNLLAVQGKSLWTAALFQTLQLAIRHFLRGGNAKLHYQPMA